VVVPPRWARREAPASLETGPMELAADAAWLV